MPMENMWVTSGNVIVIPECSYRESTKKFSERMDACLKHLRDGFCLSV
jgi:hypothetical protein